MSPISIFVISDLHLSTNTDKSMEVFGDRWANYTERIRDNWNSIVSKEDTVIIGGDVSWEMKLKDCVSDFEFINSLSGRKIISKGNHDYWWETASKHKEFLQNNGFSTIDFLYNNAFIVEDVAVCGTRWWNDPSSDGFDDEDLKIYNHELIRLVNSLKEACKLGCLKKLVVLHYPPFTADGELNSDIADIFSRYEVRECVYGHLHGAGLKNAVEGTFFGVNYRLTSADFLNFTPIEIKI